MPKIEEFIEQLRDCSGDLVYNPWKDYDKGYDISAEAPNIRAKHLNKYLRLRIPGARYIFIAEALGYQGGHFSGIAMTSERILLGNHPDIKPELVIGETGKRTSNQLNPVITNSQRSHGFNEPTATVVWKEIIDSKISPYDVLLWNIFPFHPYKTGLLTNRTPGSNELMHGITYVKKLIKLCPKAKIISIGQSSANTLDEHGIKNIRLRHPSNGGVTDFRTGFKQIFSSITS